jgi:aminoglycoside 6'-N-acetyltransferase
MRFRRLVHDDLRMLHGWLQDPGVVRWWEGDDTSWMGVVRDYGPQIDDGLDHWIALDDEGDGHAHPVGWIQCYATASFPDEEEVRAWWRLGVHRTAGGIDYLLADPARRRSGTGSRMVRAFVEDVIAVEHPPWTQVCASPYEANIASWKALRNAGFAHRGTFTSTDPTLGGRAHPGGPCRLMVRQLR